MGAMDAEHVSASQVVVLTHWRREGGGYAARMDGRRRVIVRCEQAGWTWRIEGGGAAEYLINRSTPWRTALSIAAWRIAAAHAAAVEQEI